MDRGAWWAAIYGVAQSWTRLKRLSSSSSSRILDPGKQAFLPFFFFKVLQWGSQSSLVQPSKTSVMMEMFYTVQLGNR